LYENCLGKNNYKSNWLNIFTKKWLLQGKFGKIPKKNAFFSCALPLPVFGAWDGHAK
jgi:hypothetical protein